MFTADKPSAMFSLHKTPRRHHVKQAISAIGSTLFSGLTVVLVATAIIQLRAKIPIPRLVPNGDHGNDAVVISNPAVSILLGRPN